MATTNLSIYNKENLPNAEAYRFGIVISEWNSEVTYNLHQGAIDTLLDLGAKESQIDSVFVPGSVELVYAATQLCKKEIYDAIIIIGCVI
ncbi:MAG: 6,7-dimethyl-8-ribityllumazine synthase, partial [Apibacter sp.]